MGNDIFLDTICHSDDQREEDELLRTTSEKSREHPHWQISICYRDSSLRSEWQWVLTEILLSNYVLIIVSTSLHFKQQQSYYQSLTKCRELCREKVLYTKHFPSYTKHRNKYRKLLIYCISFIFKALWIYSRCTSFIYTICFVYINDVLWI